MNARQLTIESLKKGGKPDRVAAGPFTGYFAAVHAGIPLGNYVTNGKLIAEGQLRLHEDLGQDILITAADTYYIAEAFGLKVEIHKDALPTAKAPPFTDPVEMRHLVVPDPFVDGRMPVCLEALECLRSAVGDDLAIRGTGTGPFSLAAYLLGIDNFLLRLMDIESGESSDDAERNMRYLLGIGAGSRRKGNCGLSIDPEERHGSRWPARRHRQGTLGEYHRRRGLRTAGDRRGFSVIGCGAFVLQFRRAIHFCRNTLPRAS
jgi:uroporphyrinogen decarboxylase